MLAQNMLTGQFHQVPDYRAAPPHMGGWPDPQVYGLGEVHDGLGNSLGLWFLPKLIKGAVSAVSNLVTGGGGSSASPVPPNCPPCPVCPTPAGPPGMMPPGIPYRFPPRRRRRR